MLEVLALLVALCDRWLLDSCPHDSHRRQLSSQWLPEGLTPPKSQKSPKNRRPHPCKRSLLDPKELTSGWPAQGHKA